VSGSVSAPPALSGGLLLGLHEVLAGKTVTRLQLVEPRSEPLLGRSQPSGVGSPKSAVSVFLLGNLGILPKPWLPRHLTSVVERFKYASDLGGLSSLPLASRRAAQVEHVPRRERPARPLPSLPIHLPSHFLAPLWAGHQRSSIVTPGLVPRMVTMCLLASSGYLWPGERVSSAGGLAERASDLSGRVSRAGE
jgi:hypothetical protein